MPFFGYMLGMVILTLLVGQKVAIPVFVFVYLIRWGQYSSLVATTYALATWAVMVFFYDQVMNLLFHPSYLYQWLQPMWPNVVPDWLIF